MKKTRVENDLDGVFAVSAFLVIFRTFLRQKTRRYTFSRPLPVVSNGLTKVLSVLTGGPGKVRFKKNSQIRCTLAKSGLEKVCGSRRREVVFRMAISPG